MNSTFPKARKRLNLEELFRVLKYLEFTMKLN
jgi:hypothetical protein